MKKCFEYKKKKFFFQRIISQINKRTEAVWDLVVIATALP